MVTNDLITINSFDGVAVIDTNVLVDFLSCHDVISAAKEGDRVKQDYRLRRAGWALRVGILLHEQRAETLCHIHEVIEVLRRRAPPGEPMFETGYGIAAVNFVAADLLPRWSKGALPSDRPITFKGNEADAMLVDLAKQCGCPVISNEGWGHDGFDPDKGLLVKARKADVHVLTSSDFCAGKVTASMIERFMTRFKRLGPSAQPNQPLLDDMYGFYRAALERTAGRDKPEKWRRIVKPRDSRKRRRPKG